MVNVVKLRKGLNINLKGKAIQKKVTIELPSEIGLVPAAFEGVVPKVVVNEGDSVKVGDALFVNKAFPEIKFASPVSGKVTKVVRGDRRKVLCVKVQVANEQQYVDFGIKDLSKLNGEDVKRDLLDAGLFGYINQLPYAISTNPKVHPEAIFVSALRDMPLASDFEVELEGNEEAFQVGLSALSKIAKVHLGIGPNQSNRSLTEAADVEVTIYDGPCPAGNVGVQINHTRPITKGEVIWTIDPTTVIFIGRLFLTGKVDLRKVVAVAGSEVNNPCYVNTIVGAPFSALLKGQIKETAHVRIINGNPLVGHKSCMTDYIGGHTSEVTVIPEGDDVNEMLGWISPRLSNFSVSHSYFTWLLGKKKEYCLDARIKGGERHMIMSGEYDKVLPMDIYAEYLIKAIIAGNIDRQEQLGIYEVSPEDFALAEFVDSSKMPLQKIVRDGLNTLRKENA
ncbi:Na(+)-translocating NADH-quinone reductase subunit A [Prevotella sp. A2931]|uniref:Na(+)-translocating NADH-quinone reductase subunit A n=1 Tax=Prevotella illustrans TaxID=2800387 RepID=A0ABS3M2N1_9BACT|nr:MULTISPECIES: Na(+)-translocating NADH-quinone reductase subunit A [Prevotella]MBO1362404.1 Na(+)-translocating NADH-quinone reductase subunit A [Prevotella illustrans]PTL25079.1 NADH:ubiquinone reductase (Na(+)-transporting) subunit A [Prevotella sp. oral taxon 820]